MGILSQLRRAIRGRAKPPATPALHSLVPPEIATQIIAYCGVWVCICLRHLPAFRIFVKTRMLVEHWGYRDKAVMRMCVQYRWSAGVQLLLDHSFDHALWTWPRRIDVEHIVLTPAAVCLLWRESSRINTEAMTCLVYNAIKDHITRPPPDSDQPSLGDLLCRRSVDLVVLLGAEVIRRGGGMLHLKGLREYCKQAEDDLRFTWRFASTAARHGRLDLLKAMLDIYPEAIRSQPEVLTSAAASGDLDTVKFVYDEAYRHDLDRAVLAAAASGCSDAFTWLYVRRPKGPLNVDFGLVAAGGNVDILKILDEDHPPPPSRISATVSEVIVAAARHNQARVLEWAFQSGHKPSFPIAFEDRLQTATLECLLVNLPASSCAVLLRSVAARNWLDLVEWTIRAHPKLCTVFMVAPLLGYGNRALAAKVCKLNGQRLEQVEQSESQAILAYMVTFGRVPESRDQYQLQLCSIGQDILKATVKFRNLPFVRWVLEAVPTLQFTDATISDLFMSLQWPILRYAHSVGRLPTFWPPNQTHFRMDYLLNNLPDMPIAQAGAPDLETILYSCARLRGNLLAIISGKIWTIDGCTAAGQLDTVHLLIKNGRQSATTHAMDKAAAQGSWSIVDCLHRLRSEGCTTAAMDGAAANGWLEIVKYLHTERTEGCTTAAMDGAIKSGDLDTVRWLHDNRTEGASPTAMATAANLGHLTTVQFLYEHGYSQCTPDDIQNAPKHVKDWFSGRWRELP